MARFAAVVAMVLACVSGAQADTVMDRVTVGDPGNTADTRYETPGYGGVADTYNISKYEVTNSQYAEFLNMVAASDPYGLFTVSVAFPARARSPPVPIPNGPTNWSLGATCERCRVWPFSHEPGSASPPSLGRRTFA